MKRLDVINNDSAPMSLLDEERKQIRESLLAYMERTPVMPYEEAIQVKSPYSKWLVFAVVAGIIVASTGVSFAAATALPGNLLYPIKVGINEKVRAAFAFSDTGKAQVEASLATERLKEAQMLNAQASLNAQTSADLKTDFNTHVAAFQSDIQKIKTENAAEANAEDAAFKATMASYAAILPQFSNANTAEVNVLATSSIETASSSSPILNNIIGPKTVDASTTTNLDSDININAVIH